LGAPLIIAENIAKSYGKVLAVDGLCLRVEENSIVGLIGPNGAGKTTTIKMILGLLKPDRGKIEVFNLDPWDNPEIRYFLGVIYEKAFFPAHQRVLDYLRRVCRIFGVSEIRASEVLNLVELDYAADRQIKGLSAGMLQKFAIAHALLHNPKLVIADEPTANLDPQARSTLLDLILRLHKNENVTFLISSHILPELNRVCDSVAIINNGKVWASGKLSELYAKYAAGAVRISTDNPEALAKEIVKLGYMKSIEFDTRGVSIRVKEGYEDNIYEDAAKIAKRLNVKILGIESGTASLEELYRRAVQASGGQ